MECSFADSGACFDYEREISSRIPRNGSAIGDRLRDHRGRPHSHSSAKISRDNSASADPTLLSHRNTSERSSFIRESSVRVASVLPRSAQNLHVTSQQRVFANIALSEDAVSPNAHFIAE
jgi:hypothetical protein